MVSFEFCARLFIPNLHPDYQVYSKCIKPCITFSFILGNPIDSSRVINMFKLQGRRNKKLFWLPAIAPLVSVILSTLLVYLTKADEHGVKIVKHFRGGLNPSSVHQVQFNGPHVGQAAKIGLICAVVALAVYGHSTFFFYIK